MRVLLDTHTFLWWVTDDPQLSETVRAIITDANNLVFLSVASAWEIVIKVRTGKLVLPEPPEAYIPRRLASNQFQSLGIELAHVLQVSSLPDWHRDPFDRILIAQSQVERLPLLSLDRQISQYSVQVVW
jgi:PIN domain nuclease of toxin-antitoxin system